MYLKCSNIKGTCLKVNKTTSFYKPTLGPNISKHPHQIFFFLLLIFSAAYNLTRHKKSNWKND